MSEVVLEREGKKVGERGCMREIEARTESCNVSTGFLQAATEALTFGMPQRLDPKAAK